MVRLEEMDMGMVKRGDWRKDKEERVGLRV